MEKYKIQVSGALILIAGAFIIGIILGYCVKPTPAICKQNLCEKRGGKYFKEVDICTIHDPSRPSGDYRWDGEHFYLKQLI